MGYINKLSDECNKCNYKNVCDNKRIMACKYVDKIETNINFKSNNNLNVNSMFNTNEKINENIQSNIQSNIQKNIIRSVCKYEK